MPATTPMMRQYLDIKERNSDAILFFRLGDFYEMFGDDARTASRELDLALTTRDKSTENPDERIPMCGASKAIVISLTKCLRKNPAS